MDMIRERDIERKLVGMVRRLGGRALKFVSPGTDGVPDRIILMPGKVYFVEVKAPGEKLRPLQEAVIRIMRNLDQKVFTVDSMEEIDKLEQYLVEDRFRV